MSERRDFTFETIAKTLGVSRTALSRHLQFVGLIVLR